MSTTDGAHRYRLQYCRTSAGTKLVLFDLIKSGRGAEGANSPTSSKVTRQTGRDENGNRGWQRRGDFHFFSFCLWSVITEADGGRVISHRVQQLGPSRDYIIFPNCKWSLSIHQTMNGGAKGGSGAGGGCLGDNAASAESKYERGVPLRRENLVGMVLGASANPVEKFHSRKNKWQHQKEQWGRVGENCFCSFVTNREIKAQVWLHRDSDPLSGEVHGSITVSPSTGLGPLYALPQLFLILCCWVRKPLILESCRRCFSGLTSPVSIQTQPHMRPVEMTGYLKGNKAGIFYFWVAPQNSRDQLFQIITRHLSGNQSGIHPPPRPRRQRQPAERHYQETH